MDIGPSWRPAEGGLQRIAVQGGWIYRDEESRSIAFVPAPAATAGRARPLHEVPAGEKAAAA